MRKGLMRHRSYSILLVVYRWFCWAVVLMGIIPMNGVISLAHAATPADWNKGAYAYSAEQTPLSAILTDFANSHGVDLVLGNIADNDVTAKIRAETPRCFSTGWRWSTVFSGLCITTHCMSARRMNRHRCVWRFPGCRA